MLADLVRPADALKEVQPVSVEYAEVSGSRPIPARIAAYCLLLPMPIAQLPLLPMPQAQNVFLNLRPRLPAL